MKKARTIAKWTAIIVAVAGISGFAAITWILRDPLTEFDDPNIKWRP